MLEYIIVIAIILTVAIITGRSLYRTLTGKNDGCGCAGPCPGCAIKDMTDPHRRQDANS